MKNIHSRQINYRSMQVWVTNNHSGHFIKWNTLLKRQRTDTEWKKIEIDFFIFTSLIGVERKKTSTKVFSSSRKFIIFERAFRSDFFNSSFCRAWAIYDHFWAFKFWIIIPFSQSFFILPFSLLQLRKFKYLKLPQMVIFFTECF